MFASVTVPLFLMVNTATGLVVGTGNVALFVAANGLGWSPFVRLLNQHLLLPALTSSLGPESGWPPCIDVPHCLNVSYSRLIPSLYSYVGLFTFSWTSLYSFLSLLFSIYHDSPVSRLR